MQGMLSSLVSAVLLTALFVSIAEAQVHPTGGETPDQAEEICKNLSAKAAARKANTLIISYEGLWMHSGALAQQTYEFHRNVVRGVPGDAPRGGGAGILQGLVIPAVKKHASRLEILSVSESSTNGSGRSAAEICAVQWKKGGKDRKLVILGHSYGGHAANQLAAYLNEEGVKVDLVITVDPRTKRYIGRLARTKNVVRWENYYQPAPTPLPGYAVADADVNDNLLGQAGHGSIPYAPVISKSLMKHLAVLTAQPK